MGERNKDSYEPLVSIVVPTLNSEKTIKDLLDSLMEIDYDRNRIEIIVVDGGSKDKTVEIAKKYPIKVIVVEKKGVNIARNIGVKHSSGEIIAFTDSDCVVPRDWIKKIVERFKQYEVGGIGGSIKRFYNTLLSRYADESLMPVLRVFKRRKIINDIEDFVSCPAGCNMAFRREVLEKVELFDDRIKFGFDEIELIERLCRNGYKVLLDPEVIIQHKHRESLKELLRQVFNYGKGGGVLIKLGIKGKFPKWVKQELIIFLLWITISTTLIQLSIVSSIFLISLLMLTIFPIILLLLFYTFKALSERSLKIYDVLVYPLLDLLRFIFFNIGILYGIIKKD